MLQSIFQISGVYVNFHLIAWNNDLVLIDGGFLGDFEKLEKQLEQINKSFSDISLIIMTHGHLDHTLNIARIKQLSGAQVAGHSKEKKHIAGNYPYTGISRICGMLEACGRFLFAYRPFELDFEFADNQLLDHQEHQDDAIAMLHLSPRVV